jgi:hypothetical protein
VKPRGLILASAGPYVGTEARQFKGSSAAEVAGEARVRNSMPDLTQAAEMQNRFEQNGGVRRRLSRPSAGSQMAFIALGDDDRFIIVPEGQHGAVLGDEGAAADREDFHPILAIDLAVIA